MFALTAALKLKERNFLVDFICYPQSKLYNEAKNKGLNVIPLKVKSYIHPLIIYKLSRLIKNNHYDIIHSQYSKDLWVLVPSLHLAKSTTPLFLTKQMGSFIVKKDFFHKKLYNRVTNVFAISKIIETNLLDTCPLRPQQIKLLHNFVDTKKFNPELYDKTKVRKEFNISDNEICIGMIARFSPGKGHEELINAAKLLKEKYQNIKYLIIGEPSFGEKQYADEIKKFVIDNSLSKNFIFTGFRSDTPNLLAAMDIFAFPSHSEAFGIALAEALSMGIPAVASNCDGVLDIVVDNQTGLLFERKNAQDLANKIEILIQNDKLRNEFSLASRKRAIENFDVEFLTDKVISYYKE